MNKRDFEQLVENLHPSVRKAFRESVASISDSVTISDIVARLKAGDVDGALRALGIEADAFRPLEKALTEAYERGGIATVDAIPTLFTAEGTKAIVRFGIRNLAAEHFLRELSSVFITGIVEETRQIVRNTLADGLSEGRNPRSTALDIVGRTDRATGSRQGGVIGLSDHLDRAARNGRTALLNGDYSKYLGLELRDKRFDGLVRKAQKSGEPLTLSQIEKLILRYRSRALGFRGRVISRTETLRALNAARFNAYRQALEKAGLPPEALEREWDATNDNRTRFTHSLMEGQTIKGLETPFTSPSGARMMYPGDTSLGAPAAEVIQCRCFQKMRITRRKV